VGTLTRRATLLGLVGLGGAALTGCGYARRRPTPSPTANPYVGPDLASQLIGQDVRVRMKVECADFPARGGPTFLRPSCFFEGYFFRLVIPWEKREEFVRAVGGAPEERLVERVVDARGIVRASGQWSEIVIESTEQLRIATGWRPPAVPTQVPIAPTRRP
jgi:hypothetical protein